MKKYFTPSMDFLHFDDKVFFTQKEPMKISTIISEMHSSWLVPVE